MKAPIGIVYVALMAVSCDRREPSTEPQPPARPPPSSSAELRQALADAAADVALDGPSPAAVKALLGVREQLPLAPRVLPTQRLAFGDKLLGVLTENALVVYDAASLEVLQRVAMLEPRRVAAMKDGALLAAGREATYWVRPDKRQAEPLSKLTLFPDSVLYADRRDARRLWVLHPTARSLYEHVLEPSDAALLRIASFVSLDGYAGQGFVNLADGSFAYVAGSELRRFFPEGRSWRFALAEPPGGKLELARRLDELWSAPDAGVLARLSLAGRGKSVQRVTLPFSLFDWVAQADTIAAVALDRALAGERRWRLVVLGADGNQRFDAPLQADATSTLDDWAEKMTRNLHLAISADARLVAVGGADRLAVWQTASGRRIQP